MSQKLPSVPALDHPWTKNLSLMPSVFFIQKAAQWLGFVHQMNCIAAFNRTLAGMFPFADPRTAPAQY